MKYFALRLKSGFVFRCESRGLKEFERKVQSAYHDWKGLKPKGSTASFDDFMAQYDRVEVTIVNLPKYE